MADETTNGEELISEDEIRQMVDIRAAGGWSGGRLSDDQKRAALAIATMAENVMRFTRNEVDGDVTFKNEAIRNQQEWLMHAIASAIPESAQAAPGTYDTEDPT